MKMKHDCVRRVTWLNMYSKLVKPKLHVRLLTVVTIFFFLFYKLEEYHCSPTQQQLQAKQEYRETRLLNNTKRKISGCYCMQSRQCKCTRGDHVAWLGSEYSQGTQVLTNTCSASVIVKISASSGKLVWPLWIPENHICFASSDRV